MKPAITLVALCLLCALSKPARSQTTMSYVPEGYKAIHIYGYLNGDAESDVVLLLENGTSKTIKVLFKKGNNYTLACEADKAIPDNENGVNIDKSGIKIEKGTLNISFSVPAQKVDVKYQYKFQNNEFFLVRTTQNGTDGTKSYAIDFDLVTGQMIVDKKDSSNPAGNSTTTQERKMPSLPPLTQFDPAMYIGFLGMIGNPEATQTSTQTNSETVVVTMDEMRSEEKTVALVTLDDASMDNCLHIIFSNEDFGSSELQLNLMEKQLWKELIIKEGTVTKVNPKYKGKDFEILYHTTNAIPCGSTTEKVIKVIDQISLAKQ